MYKPLNKTKDNVETKTKSEEKKKQIKSKCNISDHEGIKLMQWTFNICNEFSEISYFNHFWTIRKFIP